MVAADDEFPSYPLECMIWSQAPAVTRMLAISRPGLLPSVKDKTSALPSGCPEGYPDDHNYTHFGAQYKACNLAPSGFGLPLPGLPSDFASGLPATL